uniref:50S ribosomal protein L12, chloroplastic n=1 Tax=Pleonosporium borreri TaxID=2575635 RepID=A0A4D6WYK6_9FLOR|nr:ribosomal protein L12 [Pleonosporium borreri]
MSSKINNIIEELKSLTLLEAAELVKQIEDVFNVDTSSVANTGVVMMSQGDENSQEDQKDEKTEFDVVLEAVPAAKKIAILKSVRAITELGLKEAKALVDDVPKAIKEGASKEEAESTKQQLEEAGAKVSIK